MDNAAANREASSFGGTAARRRAHPGCVLATACLFAAPVWLLLLRVVLNRTFDDIALLNRSGIPVRVYYLGPNSSGRREYRFLARVDAGRTRVLTHAFARRNYIRLTVRTLSGVEIESIGMARRCCVIDGGSTWILCIRPARSQPAPQ